MKQLVTALVILVSANSVVAYPNPVEAHSGIVKRGVAIPADAKSVTIAQLRQNPEAYGKDPVVVEGVVSKACWIRGCWMRLAEDGGASIHVTFRGNLTVPRGSKGRRARIVGVVRSKVEKAKPQVFFVASGVELMD
jgi:hypothetical protein